MTNSWLAEYIVPVIKGSVLIIDDDRCLLETLTQALNDEGFFVVGALDGAEAISSLNMIQYDLILVDLHMPRVGGIEVVELFKDLSVATPIVVITGDSNARRFAESLSLAGYLEKPFGLEDILAVVKTHCKPVPFSLDR